MDRAAGVPFTLALVADLLGTDPGITPDQLVGPQASMPYLVERVIGRIEDVRLRWVVRAGVVPRRLSFDFFRHVLAPLLTEVAAETFPDDEDDLRGLWDRLIDYVGSRSWIALSPAQPDTVVFHPANCSARTSSRTAAHAGEACRHRRSPRSTWNAPEPNTAADRSAPVTPPGRRPARSTPPRARPAAACPATNAPARPSPARVASRRRRTPRPG